MTQVERIIEYMNKNGSISQYEAITQCGVLRLASRIHDIRMMGYNVEKTMVSKVNRYGQKTSVAEYRIKKAE